MPLQSFVRMIFLLQNLMELKNELQTYIIDMQSDTKIFELNGIEALAQKMVEKKKDEAYPLAYRLVKYIRNHCHVN